MGAYWVGEADSQRLSVARRLSGVPRRESGPARPALRRRSVAGLWRRLAISWRCGAHARACDVPRGADLRGRCASRRVRVCREGSLVRHASRVHRPVPRATGMKAEGYIGKKVSSGRLPCSPLVAWCDVGRRAGSAGRRYPLPPSRRRMRVVPVEEGATSGDGWRSRRARSVQV